MDPTSATPTGFSYARLNYGSPLKPAATAGTPSTSSSASLVHSSEDLHHHSHAYVDGTAPSRTVSDSSMNGGIQTYEESFTPSVFSSPAHIAAYAQQGTPLHLASVHGTSSTPPVAASGPASGASTPAAFSPYVVTPFPNAHMPRSHQLQQVGVVPPRSLSFGSGDVATQRGGDSTIIDTASFHSPPPSAGGSGSGITPARQTSPRSYGIDLVRPAQSLPATPPASAGHQAFTEVVVQPTSDTSAGAATPTALYSLAARAGAAAAARVAADLQCAAVGRALFA